MRIEDGTMRRCEWCRKAHHTSLFPSPVSTQCASSMLGRHVNELDIHHPTVIDIAAVEVVSGLPVARWVKTERRWHLLWSKLMYARAIAKGKAPPRLKMWLETEAPKDAT